MHRYLTPTFVVLCYASFLAALAVAQTDSPTDSTALYKLEGVVVNAQTGHPIPHALVEVFGSSKAAMLTDSEGHFAFENLPMGTITLSTRKPGFFAPGSTENGFLRNIELGPNTNKVELRLVPEAGFSGEVTDSDGEPLEGASVQVLAAKLIEGRRQMMPVGRNVTTDALVSRNTCDHAC